MTHICVGNLTIIGSNNGLALTRRTNDGILLIGPLGTNFGDILIEIQKFSLKKIRVKMSSVKCLFCMPCVEWVWMFFVLSFYVIYSRTIASIAIFVDCTRLSIKFILSYLILCRPICLGLLQDLV